MSRRRNVSKPDAAPNRLATARSLAKQLGGSAEQYRLVDIWYYDGQQWTLQSRWEYQVGKEWKEVPWTALIEQR